MIADMLSNNNLPPIVTQLFIRGRKHGKVKHELRIQLYELRVPIHELRVQIHKIADQKYELHD